MRVLHLIPCLGLSGAEKQLSFLGAALAARGVDCHVAFFEDALEDHLNRGRLEAAGVSLHRLVGRSPYDPRLLWSIRSLVRRLHPDLVQTWLAMMDVVGGLALRGTDMPWVVSERNTPTLIARDAKMRVRDRIVPWCDAVVANSNSGCAYWRERLGASAPCCVIQNSIEIDALIAAAPGDPGELGLRSDAPLVVYIGRLWPHKNMGGLLEALRRIVADTDACAAVIGTGSEHPRVLDFVRAHGLAGRVAAPGFIPDPWPWLRRADVFLSLSYTEGMPNTVMEAVACGCPVVLSDIAPHRDLLDDGLADFVAPDDAAAAARAVVSLLRDPAAARRRIESGERAASAWRIDTAVDAYQNLYRHLLERRGTPVPAGHPVVRDEHGTEQVGP